MRGLIPAGDGEMMRLMNVLFRKIDGVHIDVGAMEDFVRVNAYVREIEGCSVKAIATGGVGFGSYMG